MSIASQAERLLQLAKTRTHEDRERLLLAIADLCETAESVGALDTTAVQALVNDIFMCLVVDAILTQDEPAVLTALATNDSALISHDGMARLVEASRSITALRTPLTRHPHMTEDLAERSACPTQT